MLTFSRYCLTQSSIDTIPYDKIRYETIIENISEDTKETVPIQFTDKLFIEDFKKEILDDNGHDCFKYWKEKLTDSSLYLQIRRYKYRTDILGFRVKLEGNASENTSCTNYCYDQEIIEELETLLKKHSSNDTLYQKLFTAEFESAIDSNNKFIEKDRIIKFGITGFHFTTMKRSRLMPNDYSFNMFWNNGTPDEKYIPYLNTMAFYGLGFLYYPHNAFDFNIEFGGVTDTIYDNFCEHSSIYNFGVPNNTGYFVNFGSNLYLNSILKSRNRNIKSDPEYLNSKVSFSISYWKMKDQLIDQSDFNSHINIPSKGFHFNISLSVPMCNTIFSVNYHLSNFELLTLNYELTDLSTVLRKQKNTINDQYVSGAIRFDLFNNLTIETEFILRCCKSIFYIFDFNYKIDPNYSFILKSGIEAKIKTSFDDSILNTDRYYFISPSVQIGF